MKSASIEEIDSYDIQIDEDDIAHVIEGIQEAEYFDSDSMAPLSPASLVSIK